MNTVSLIPSAPVTPQPATASKSSASASASTASVAASVTPEPVISSQAKALAKLFEEVNANGQKISYNNPDGSLFGEIQNRFSSLMVGAFTENDKKLLGQAYEMAKDNEKYEKKMDELSLKLGALRIQQQLNGELVRSTEVQRDLNGDGKINSDDHPYQPEPAHLEILGFMKYMAEHKD